MNDFAARQNSGTQYDGLSSTVTAGGFALDARPRIFERSTFRASPSSLRREPSRSESVRILGQLRKCPGERRINSTRKERADFIAISRSTPRDRTPRSPSPRGQANTEPGVFPRARTSLPSARARMPVEVQPCTDMHAHTCRTLCFGRFCTHYRSHSRERVFGRSHRGRASGDPARGRHGWSMNRTHRTLLATFPLRGSYV